MINFHWLFSGTAIGFIASALLVVTIVLPRAKPSGKRSEGIYKKTTRGARIYLKTPRLRGFLAITLASAAASAMVIVNTVVIVRDTLGLGQREVALTLAAYGGGSMLAALTLPRILERVGDRISGCDRFRPNSHIRCCPPPKSPVGRKVKKRINSTSLLRCILCK